MKRCSACREWKRFDEYHKSPINKDGHDHRCKPCANAYQRSRYSGDYQRRKNQIMVRDAMRQARKYKAAINDLTEDDLHRIVVGYDGRCAYCGARPRLLTCDHVQPLSKGGNNTLANVVPSCRPCNSRKSYRTPEQAGMNFTVQPRYGQMALL